MDQLVRQHGAVGERTLEITFLEPDAEACAFTSGECLSALIATA